jgi:two-component system phosphate regulon response regulator PhoB
MFFKSTPKKILIVDDDPSLLRQLRFRLEERDRLSVVVAESGESGLEQTATNDFDLIILDWMLPDMQGIDVLTELKNGKDTKDIPVLMLTGRNKLGEVEEAFSRGADGYLTKPFELGKLGSKVKEMLA